MAGTIGPFDIGRFHAILHRSAEEAVKRRRGSSDMKFGLFGGATLAKEIMPVFTGTPSACIDGSRAHVPA